ncbi:MAG: family 1 glycosylhydrolase, partial [Ginsengibacter sp.]
MDTNYPLLHPELWGGLECTINRIGDTWRDQLAYANHYNRSDDLDKIAALGIKKLRYPILWDYHQKEEGQKIDWTFTKKKLERIRELNIIPIVGLLHHGSGPIFTNLLDENFSKKLAEYAGKVAAEFPWIDYYTPVNEPLTTARFSGLYGHWYPHHQSDESFCRILINQLKGIVLSMKEIRKVNPFAKLIQTEDLARIHSTPRLRYQARFENQRRWLTYDILCGMVNEEHALWDYFLSNGINSEDLQYFTRNQCIPDVMGYNYYITSERFLDDNIKIYPDSNLGGNGHHTYVDVSAVRVLKPYGLKRLLREAWKRFHLPIALTEVHINCTREEQLRWFKEAWDICIALNKDGLSLQGVTAWSLLGSYDWTSLLVEKENSYESGVFDLTGNCLRPTAMTKLLKSVSKKGNFLHPVLNEKGWWHRSYPESKNIFMNNSAHPLLIFGCEGTLGKVFIQSCLKRSICYKGLNRQEADITDISQIKSAIHKYRPWAIINASGYVCVDGAEKDVEKCFRLNTYAPGELATLCNKYGIQLMNFSTDLVFDGKKAKPYEENDLVKPLNIYGSSKAEGERMVMSNFKDSLIIRT